MEFKRKSAATATFLTEPEAEVPSFRLTYTGKGPDVVSMKFEVAPPGISRSATSG